MSFCKKKILMVFGTRPEAIKMCPLYLALKASESFETKLCVTGQHEEMLQQVLDIFNVAPDYNLHVMKKNQNLFDITENILHGLRGVLDIEKPDLVLVHGDTTTTFTAALSSFYLQIPVGHVEAGLRTYDIYSPFPEEFNRETVSLISRFDFAPTSLAKANLLKMGKSENRIFVTGNTGIDSLRTTIRKDYKNAELSWAEGSRIILLTAHRRENVGKPMAEMFSAIKKVVDEHPDIKVIYPVHLNPAVQSIADKAFCGDSRIHLIEPLDVLDFHNFMSRSFLILTDSGGVQEEAPSLGKPVLVLRDTTERPEGVEAGTLRLVGTSFDSVYKNFTLLLNDENEYRKMAVAKNPYGDGHASERIVRILEKEMF